MPREKQGGQACLEAFIDLRGVCIAGASFGQEEAIDAVSNLGHGQRDNVGDEETNKDEWQEASDTK